MADAWITPLPPLERSRTHWRLLLRAIGVASDPRSLILAALGVVAMRAGWNGLAQVFDLSVRQEVPDFFSTGSQSDSVYSPVLSVFRPALSLLQPFVAFFRPDLAAGERLYYGLVALWTLLVWSLFGGAIARIAVVRVATSGRVGILSALRFSITRLGTLLAAPLVPLGVACLIGLAGAAVGLLNRLVPAAATLFAFIPLIVGLLNAVILLGLAAAWPLMVATVAAEGEDFFDAVSRSYSYVNQHFFRYVGYLGLAAIIGGLGFLLLNLFATTTLSLADWSVSLGAPRQVGFRFGLPSTVDASDLPVVAHFWQGLVEAILSGWTSSYLWSTAAIIYLVLRHDVDGAEIHEIYQPRVIGDKIVTDEPTIEAGPHEVGPAKAD